MSKIILDISSKYSDLIKEYQINVNDPGEIDRIDNLILKNQITLLNICVNELENLLTLRKYLFKRHNFLTNESKQDES